MEPRRPTLAIAGLAFAGLAACGASALARLPGPDGGAPRPVRVVTVAAATPAPALPWLTAGTGPSAGLRGAEPAALMAGSAALLAPRQTVAPPVAERAVAPLPGGLAAPAFGARGAEASGDRVRGSAG